MQFLYLGGNISVHVKAYLRLSSLNVLINHKIERPDLDDEVVKLRFL
jgi:hypothetical protein